MTTTFVCATAAACSAAGAMTLGGPGLPGRAAADAVLAAILVGYLCAPHLLAGEMARPPMPAG